MNLLDLFVSIKARDEVSGVIAGISSGARKVAGGVAAAGAAVGAAVTAAGAGVAAMGSQAMEAYASYEQLAGGVEKLYGDSSAKLKEYADQAYQTAGMSANQYMETATQFSSSLIKSLDGDTAKAADQTDKAMRLISDNVNVFGSNAEDVQNAIKGISRENYTMVDNLKLGYAGTKEGMAQLIADANAYAASQGKVADLQMGNFSDMIDAIELIQEKQGIAGTTAKEAATTIEGSIAMTKAAWANLLTEFGKDDGDVGARMKELVDSAKTALLGSVDEATGEVQGGIIPRAKQIIGSIAEALPDMIPQLLDAGMQVFGAIGEAIPMVLPALLDGVTDAVKQLASFISENKSEIVGGAFDMLTGLMDALIEIAPPLVQALVELLAELVAQVIAHAPDMLAAAVRLVNAIAEGIFGAAWEVANAASDAIQGAIDAVGDFVSDMFDVGANLIQGLIDGIGSMVGSLVSSVGDAVSSIPDKAAELLGIASPSKVFRRIGEYTMQGLAEGISGRTRDAVGAVESAMRAVAGVSAPSYAFSANAGATGVLGASGNVYYVTIDGTMLNVRQRVVNALDEIATAIEQEAVM